MQLASTSLLFRLLRGRIFRRVAAEAGGDQRALRRRLLEAQRRLYRADRAYIVDGAAEGHLVLCTSILAAVQIGVEALERARVLAAIEDELRAVMRGRERLWLLVRFGVSPARKGDAFVDIGRNFRSRGSQRFGRGFQYVETAKDDEQLRIEIRACFFFDTFRRHGEPSLTSLLCPLDDMWSRELNDHATEYGVRFERPSTLATGADRCRFDFYRVRSDP